MSLAGRPRVIVNGTRRTRTFHFFWCQHCQRTIRFTTTNPYEIFCPHCTRQLYQELDIIPRSNLVPATRLLDTLALTLDTSTTPSNNNTNSTRNPTWQNNDDSWINLNFGEPRMVQEEVADNGFDDFTMAVAENDRPGPPPAPVTAIEALPMVKISDTHLIKDVNCPVCKEEFEVGGEVKELPCKHLYHSDCIVPWLYIHNTCPVCRYELKDDDNDDRPEEGMNGNGENSYRFEEVVADNIDWLWSQLMSLTPIRVFAEWTKRYLDLLDDRMNDTHGGQILIFAFDVLVISLFMSFLDN